jgi:hypothetical protein
VAEMTSYGLMEGRGRLGTGDGSKRVVVIQWIEKGELVNLYPKLS